MKFYRIGLLVAFIVFSLLQAGCRDTWTVDFTRTEEAELELDNWGGYTSWNMVEEPVKGVDVYQYHITTPVGFPGDFTLTLDMFLDVDPLNTATFRIWIGEDEGEAPANSVLCDFKYTGDSLNDNEELNVYVDDGGSDPTFGPIKPIPGLKVGNNSFKLDKKGNEVEIRLNGVRILTFELVSFNPIASYVSFLTDEYSNVRVVFKKISVSYEGDLVPL